MTSQLDQRRIALEQAARAERHAVAVAVPLALLAIAAIGATATHAFPAAGWTAAIAVIVAIAAVRWRGRRTARRQRLAFAVDWWTRADARRADRFDAQADDGAAFCDPDHAFAADLDLFGPGSLFQRLNGCHTEFGRRRLAQILTGTPAAATVHSRQESVRAMIPLVDAREALEVELRVLAALAPAHSLERERLLRNTAALRDLDRDPPAKPSQLTVIVAVVLATVATLAWIGALLDVLPSAIAMAAQVTNLVVLAMHRGVARRLAHFELVDRTLLAWSTVFGAAARVAREVPGLAQAATALDAGPTDAPTAIANLHGLVAWLSQRRNLLYLITVDALLLLDLHADRAILRWQRRHAADLRRWFDAAAEVEAMAALADYAATAVDHTWPEVVDPATPQFHADRLAHALLPRSTRVGNDYRLDQPGTVMVITGSNMSGKSTYLRAAGVAAVMANAGLPVVATALRWSALPVFSVMRATDSLRSGTSLFLAEVRRLKRCLDAAARGPTLVLLDEILAGTNSQERHLGAIAVLRLLAERGALTLVSTHDLALSRIADELPGNARVMHFRDAVDDGRMTFDFALQDGVLRSTNALRVMRAEGIPVTDPVDPPPSDEISH